MNFKLKKCLLLSALATATALPALTANAGGTIDFGDNKSITVGFGMRGSFDSKENGAPNGSGWSQDFSLDSARLFFSASLNENIKGMFNTEKDIAGEGFQPIDANVQITLIPELTIWAGRFLSPSDRANLAGPYYSLGGGYWSGIASRYGYNGGIIGRDDGVAAVGALLDGKLSYSVGAFDGKNEFKIAPVTVGPRTGSSGLMYAGRLQYDFWDAEPGYYGTGNYLGGKDILAIGIAGRYQKGGSFSFTKTDDYSSYSVDFLMEKKDVGPGAVSVEAAYYDYDTNDVFLSEQGKAWSAGAGYIFSDKIGWGQFQPFVRYQKFDSDAAVSNERKYDLGVAYIIDGYNAQISGFYSNDKLEGLSSTDEIKVSMQFQF